jgi:transmembrane sensor
MKNIVEFESRAVIEHQAREWLIKLDGEEPLTHLELISLRDWMARSPAHRHELTRICKFWSQANILTELAVPLNPPGRATHARRLRIALAATAAIAFIAASGWWWLYRFQEPQSGTYVTGIGERKTIVLADGSSVRLNTNTQVQVAYTDHLRRIRLWRGEALFSAAPDPNRAFEVYANDSVVRALGTAFSVHLEGDKVDVVVTTGTVDVAELDSSEAEALESDKQPTHHRAPPSLGLLKAGQTTTIGGGGKPIDVQQLPERELQRRMAWQDGYLAFAGESLTEVVQQINRYSSVTLTIGDPQIATVAVGGRFKIGDLDAILDALHTNFGIQARV